MARAAAARGAHVAGAPIRRSTAFFIDRGFGFSRSQSLLPRRPCWLAASRVIRFARWAAGQGAYAAVAAATAATAAPPRRYAAAPDVSP
jgi:hypothetical protein